MCIFAVTPQIAIGDDQFLANFLDDKAMKCVETVLRLDNCTITTNGFCRAIDVNNFQISFVKDKIYLFPPPSPSLSNNSFVASKIN